MADSHSSRPAVSSPINICVNGLSNHITSAETMESFKRRLGKLMDEENRWNYAAVLTQGLL